MSAVPLDIFRRPLSNPGEPARPWGRSAAMVAGSTGDDAMQYALLIYENEALYRTDEGRSLAEVIAAHQALAGELAAQEVLRGGSGLKTADTATTVRKEGGAHALHDGPYAEAREQLGGFYLVDVPDLDAALAIARRIPFAGDGAIEVRPMIED